jgi:hypothetical protein
MRRKLHLLLVFFILGVITKSFSQEIEVSGQVLDESGMPIPGASVYQKGTTVGTTTNFDGEYSLNVTGNNPVLVFSYVGFQTQAGN